MKDLLSLWCTDPDSVQQTREYAGLLRIPGAPSMSFTLQDTGLISGTMITTPLRPTNLYSETCQMPRRFNIRSSYQMLTSYLGLKYVEYWSTCALTRCRSSTQSHWRLGPVHMVSIIGQVFCLCVSKRLRNVEHGSMGRRSMEPLQPGSHMLTM